MVADVMWNGKDGKGWDFGNSDGSLFKLTDLTKVHPEIRTLLLLAIQFPDNVARFVQKL